MNNHNRATNRISINYMNQNINKTSRNDALNLLPEALRRVQGAGWPRGQEVTWMTPGPSCSGSPCQVVWGWLRGQRRGTDPDCLCQGTALRVWPPPRSSPPQTWARAGLWLVRQGDVIRGWLWDVLVIYSATMMQTSIHQYLMETCLLGLTGTGIYLWWVYASVWTCN